MDLAKHYDNQIYCIRYVDAETGNTVFLLSDEAAMRYPQAEHLVDEGNFCMDTLHESRDPIRLCNSLLHAFCRATGETT